MYFFLNTIVTLLLLEAAFAISSTVGSALSSSDFKDQVLQSRDAYLILFLRDSNAQGITGSIKTSLEKAAEPFTPYGLSIRSFDCSQSKTKTKICDSLTSLPFTTDQQVNHCLALFVGTPKRKSKNSQKNRQPVIFTGSVEDSAATREFINNNYWPANFKSVVHGVDAEAFFDGLWGQPQNRSMVVVVHDQPATSIGSIEFRSMAFKLHPSADFVYYQVDEGAGADAEVVLQSGAELESLPTILVYKKSKSQSEVLLLGTELPLSATYNRIAFEADPTIREEIREEMINWLAMHIKGKPFTTKDTSAVDGDTNDNNEEDDDDDARRPPAQAPVPQVSEVPIPPARRVTPLELTESAIPADEEWQILVSKCTRRAVPGWDAIVANAGGKVAAVELECPCDAEVEGSAETTRTLGTALCSDGDNTKPFLVTIPYGEYTKKEFFAERNTSLWKRIPARQVKIYAKAVGSTLPDEFVKFVDEEAFAYFVQHNIINKKLPVLVAMAPAAGNSTGTSKNNEEPRYVPNMLRNVALTMAQFGSLALIQQSSFSESFKKQHGLPNLRTPSAVAVVVVPPQMSDRRKRRLTNVDTDFEMTPGMELEIKVPSYYL